MSRKWSVRKRDGAWCVFDVAGRLRYATDNHFMALSFALMKGERRRVTLDSLFMSGNSWNDALRSIWERRKEVKDDEGEQPGE